MGQVTKKVSDRYVFELKKVESLVKLNQFDEASVLLSKILTKEPKNPLALYYMGIVAIETNQINRALYFLEKACTECPKVAIFHQKVSIAYLMNKNFEKAIAHLKTAINSEPHNLDSYSTLGNILLSRGNYKLAREILLQGYNNADPKQYLPNTYIKLCELLATTYLCLQDYENSIKFYEKVLSLDTNNVTAYVNLGQIALSHGELTNALSNFQAALSLEPYNANANNNLGNLYLELKQPNDAITAFSNALQCEDKLLPAMVNLAKAYSYIGSYTDAKALLNKVLANCGEFVINSTQPKEYFLSKARVLLCICYANTCSWDMFNQEFVYARQMIWQTIRENLEPIIDPFMAMGLSLDLCLQQAIIAQYENKILAESKKFIKEIQELQLKEKLTTKRTLCFVSPDFNNHPVGLLLGNLLSVIDREKFNVIAIYLNDKVDEFTNLIKSSVDDFILAKTLSDIELYEVIANLHADILFDLAGHTTGNRYRVLLQKPCKVQVAWLGSHSTYGQACDYMLGTMDLTPVQCKEYFNEKFVYLPHYTIATPGFSEPNRHKESMSRKTRFDYGLPEDKFIFVCFARNYRITEDVVEVWMEILSRCPNSVLWLNEITADNHDAHDRFYIHAKRNNIASNRIIFTKSETLTANWHFCLADAWLDPFCVSSGTASMLCAWAGLPVVTLNGDIPQARSAACVMKNMGLEKELVANSREEYVAHAFNLAAKPNYYKSILQRMFVMRQESPLFKTRDFVKSLELAVFRILENEQKKFIDNIVYAK